MSTTNLRRWLKENSNLIKYSQIAKESGFSRQVMNYWLQGDRRGSSFNPQPGIDKLYTLAGMLSTGKITEETFNRFKKFIVLSNVAEEFFGCRSSTINVNISRHGIVHYHNQIRRLATHIKTITKPVKTCKPSKNKSKKFVFKLKIS